MRPRTSRRSRASSARRPSRARTSTSRARRASGARFLRTAKVLEDTGVAAYQGQAPLIHQNAVLAPAGAILAVEARHAAWVRDLLYAGKAVKPAPEAFSTPMSMSQVLSAVKKTGFIKPDQEPKCQMRIQGRSLGRPRLRHRRRAAGDRRRRAPPLAPRVPAHVRHRRSAAPPSAGGLVPGGALRRDAQGRRRDPQLRAHARVPGVGVLRLRAQARRADGRVQALRDARPRARDGARRGAAEGARLRRDQAADVRVRLGGHRARPRSPRPRSSSRTPACRPTRARRRSSAPRPCSRPRSRSTRSRHATPPGSETCKPEPRSGSVQPGADQESGPRRCHRHRLHQVAATPTSQPLPAPPPGSNQAHEP